MSTKKKEKKEGAITIYVWLAGDMDYPVILSESVIEEKGEGAQRKSGRGSEVKEPTEIQLSYEKQLVEN